MTADITPHPACRPVPAMECADVNNASVEDIRAAASLLHTIARHTRQPITPTWLYFVARVGQAQADDIEYTADLWRRLPVEPLPAADHQAIVEHVANIRRLAKHLATWGDGADICPPSREHVADALTDWLATAGALNQAISAAWTACRAGPDPAA